MTFTQANYGLTDRENAKFNGTLTGSETYVNTASSFVDSSTGEVKNLQFNAEAPQVCAQDYLQALAEGDISGHTPWAKIGYNMAIGTTEEDMWTPGTKYVWPTVGSRMYLASTSAGDTQSGVGVQQVRIRYLDPNYVSKQEIVTLSGTTVVPTLGSDFFRINSFRVTSCGDSVVATGNITIGSGTVNYSYLGSGFTRARNIIYTVPSGQTLYVTSIAFSSSSPDASPYKPSYSRYATKATLDDTGSNVNFFMPYNEVVLLDSAYNKTLEMPTKLTQKTDIKVTAIANVAGNIGTCALRGWLE